MKAMITRADDYGSSHAANIAIAEAAAAGFIKNVSVMACGPFLAEAAGLLAKDKNICFGLHGCINSEWDRTGWGPVAPREKVSTLIDERGLFYQNPSIFQMFKPDLAEIITEYQYQLERVRNIGFDIKYMDSHMFPENYIPDLQEKMSRMIEKEGLLDHIWFNHILEEGSWKAQPLMHFTQVLPNINGQVLLILHPARDSEEMRMTGNKEVCGETVAIDREKDYQIAADVKNVKICEKHGISLLRYDEAKKLEKPYEVKWIRLSE